MQAYQRRVIDNPRKDEVLRKLDSGHADGIPKTLKLEGSTRADCLIECERAFVWIEGKRDDWLSPSTKWDVTALSKTLISSPSCDLRSMSFPTGMNGVMA